MTLRIPDFYDSFHCTGGACPDNCCIGWELDIDEETYEYYKNVPGAFGDRLRRSMADAADAGKRGDVLGDGTEDARSFRLEIGGRCPFLNRQNLCDIVLSLGEEALCRVCTDYPRYTFEWGGVTEKSLTLSCPEAGRLMFLNNIPISFKEIELQDEGLSSYMEEEYDESAAALPDDAEFEDNWDKAEDEKLAEYVLMVRSLCIKILQDRTLPLGERVEKYLALSQDMQKLINESENIEDVFEPSKEPENDKDAFELGNEPENNEDIFERNKEPGNDKDAFELGNESENNEDIFERKLPGILAEYQSGKDWFPGHTWAVSEESFRKRLALLDKLEVINDRWTEILENTKAILDTGYKRRVLHWLTSADCDEVHYEHLLVYYTFRYFPRAAYDCCLYEKALFAVFCSLMVRDLDAARYALNGGSFSFTDRLQTMAEFSREVEHSDYNIEALFEGLSFAD